MSIAEIRRRHDDWSARPACTGDLIGIELMENRHSPWAVIALNSLDLLAVVFEQKSRLEPSMLR